MIIVRKAELEDLPQLANLFNLYRIFYKQDPDLDSAKIFIEQRLYNSDSVIFVADKDDLLVGFTQLYPQLSSIRMKRSWLLNDLYVLSEYRGQGISKQLIESAKELSRNSLASGILLETDKSNQVGNKLYPSAGFTPYDKINFYWWETSQL